MIVVMFQKFMEYQKKEYKKKKSRLMPKTMIGKILLVMKKAIYT